MSNEFNIESYFKRIKYDGRKDVSFETLYGLHVAHTLNVPFENLDIINKKPILLDKESLYKKIVEGKRGGYCYEMNGFFSIVLKEMGFKVMDLLARVTKDGINYGAKTHQVLIVEIDGKKYLSDVGFGVNGITAPLLLEIDIDQQQFANTYRFIKDDEFDYVLQKKTDDTYQYMYGFKMETYYPIDFIMSSHFSSTYPESLFLQRKFCTMPTEEGRITLTDESFKIVENEKVKEVKLSNEKEFDILLRKHFPLNK